MPKTKLPPPSRIAFRGRAFTVRVDTVTKPNGIVTTREIVEHPDCVVIVALDSELNCLLEKQVRPAAGKELLELPAGGIDPGETPDDCVRRELREETGYMPGHIKRLGGFFSAPGFCTEYLHLYLAMDLELSPLHASDTDEITVVRVPLEKTAGLVSSGAIEDAKSIAGLLTVLAFYRDQLPGNGQCSPGGAGIDKESKLSS